MNLPDACPAVSAVVLPSIRMCWWPTERTTKRVPWSLPSQCLVEVPLVDSLGLCPEHKQEAKERNPL